MCYFSKTSNIFYNIFFFLYNKSDLFRQSLPLWNILSMTIGFGAYEYQLVSICDNDKIIINIIFLFSTIDPISNVDNHYVYVIISWTAICFGV